MQPTKDACKSAIVQRRQAIVGSRSFITRLGRSAAAAAVEFRQGEERRNASSPCRARAVPCVTVEQRLDIPALLRSILRGPAGFQTSAEGSNPLRPLQAMSLGERELREGIPRGELRVAGAVASMWRRVTPK